MLHFDNTPDLDNLSDQEKIDYLINILIARATGGNASDDDYRHLRNYFIQNPLFKRLLPKIVLNSYDLNHYWQTIKYQFSTYAERRSYIWEEITPIKKFIESGSNVCSEHIISAHKKLDCDYIIEKWQGGVESVTTDPERTLTLARTILESTLKYILDDMEKDYKEKDDLPKLYKNVADELNLSPSLHHEDIFKKILGGCQTTVEGLGTLRNKLSDAHGRGKTVYKIKPRHAELAINLAGSMSKFLLETYEDKSETLDD